MARTGSDKQIKAGINQAQDALKEVQKLSTQAIINFNSKLTELSEGAEKNIEAILEYLNRKA